MTSSDHSEQQQHGSDASLLNENDVTAELEPGNSSTVGKQEKEEEAVGSEKQIHSSYISSCSDSSLSYENESEKNDMNSNAFTRNLGHEDSCVDNLKVDTCTEEGVVQSISKEKASSNDEDNVVGIPNDCNACSDSHLITSGGEISNTELPPEVLCRRIESLESQLTAIQAQLSSVLATIEFKSTPGKNLKASHQVPKVHRVSSILLNDLHESSDLEQEITNIREKSSPETSGRDSSPAPNLEYRSYTPTYEEELLKYRKSSRGLSMDCNVETDKNSDPSTESKMNSEIHDNGTRRNLETKQTTPIKRNKVDIKEESQNSKEIVKNSGNHEKTEEEILQYSTSNCNQDEKCFEQNPNENNVHVKSDKCNKDAQKLGFVEAKWNAILALFDSLNLDSRQHDGSATEDVDANMEEFLHVPWRIEELMSFGTIICADAFLHVLTVTPLKFIWSCLCLVCTILNPGKGIGWCRFHRRHLYQFVRVFVIYAVYKYCLSPISIGKMYHWIRGQAMLKLYVLMAMVEVFDRLMCSFGQDALDSLFWNTTRRPFHPRMLLSFLVVLGYAIIHSYILFVHVATLNVAMNSADQTLLTLLISGNFAEIKSTVFKKYNKQNLFKIVSSDICERFKLVLFLGLVLLLNCSQGGMNQEMVNEYIHMSLIIFLAEMLCDWIKHSFITKFNFIKSSAYQHYALILAGDITGVGQDGLNVDHTHKVVKRLGFAQIPLVCVMARYVAEAVRYADNLSKDGDSNHVLYSIAIVLSKGTRAQVGSMLITLLIVLSILKGLLGQAVENRSHTVIHLEPEPEGDNCSVPTSKPNQRRQAA